MSALDWSALKGGDPDPTPNDVPRGHMCPTVFADDVAAALLDQGMSAHMIAITSGGIVFCTRGRHGDGIHVAGDGRSIVVVWSDRDAFEPRWRPDIVEVES